MIRDLTRNAHTQRWPPHDGPRANVYFGGNAEDVSRNLASFDTEFPDYALYLMHYRGYGGSTGTPSGASLSPRQRL